MIQRTSKSLKLSIVVLAASSLPAFAQELGQVKVSVPFAFRAGSVTLPAGDYSFAENQAGVLSIEGRKGSAMMITHPGEPITPKTESTLEFDKAGSVPVLKEVRMGGNPASLLPTPR